MKIIEFAFSGDRFNEHLPHCYEPNSVVYGGTHDNETLAGYFKTEKRQWWELQYIADYLGAAHQSEVVDKVFRAAYGSVASVAVFQMQDVLKLDNWARMNTEYGGEKLEMEDEAGAVWRGTDGLPGMAGRYIRPFPGRPLSLNQNQ